MSVAVAAAGALAWTGCGSSANSTTCDDAGVCTQCDGYGCSTVGPGGEKLDAGVDSGSTSNKDSGSKPKPDASTKPDGSKEDAAKTDAKSDAPVKPVCGGSNGPCACTKSADCSNGDSCIAGACEPASSVCELSSQCSGNQACANGQCLTACSAAAPCGAGFTCTAGVCEANPSTSTCATSADCNASAPLCVSGSCTVTCTADSQCPSGDYCDQGACVLDTRPSPDCSTNSQCDVGQKCEDGYCLYTCNTNMDCEDIDARIPVCVDNVCRAPAEANPACTTQADCDAGQSCVSNVCQ